MTVVSIHQPDGYSGLFRSHGSKEFVRFFIDWGRGDGYEMVNLVHFKVCDIPLAGDSGNYPYYELVTTPFDEDRYWDCVLDGIQPKVRAVLSWQQVPPLATTFTPVFGNVIESRIRVDSIREVINNFSLQEMLPKMEKQPYQVCVHR